MKKIGLTGGIASGKSLISGYFKTENVIVLDADKIYKNLLKTNKILYNEIKEEFNLEELDLTILSEIVFNDQLKLNRLNEITHPFVMNVFTEELDKLEKTEKLVVLDIPLLYEAKMKSFCDEIICVYIDEKIQLERLIKRNKLSTEEALKRINSQMPLSKKSKMSKYVIDNSGDKESTYLQFQRIYQKIKESIKCH
ncbi:MAG: dephospho-CoA kinase [Candidatus Izemoplasmatales bacterium]